MSLIINQRLLTFFFFIKQCREQNYHKQQIMEMLSEKGFPITVDEAVEDVKKALEGNNSEIPY